MSDECFGEWGAWRAVVVCLDLGASPRPPRPTKGMGGGSHSMRYLRQFHERWERGKELLDAVGGSP